MLFFMRSTFLSSVLLTGFCSIYFITTAFAENLIKNPSFSKTIVTDDIWVGVDKECRWFERYSRRYRRWRYADR